MPNALQPHPYKFFLDGAPYKFLPTRDVSTESGECTEVWVQMLGILSRPANSLIHSLLVFLLNKIQL
jgi:hypothetical protein